MWQFNKFVRLMIILSIIYKFAQNAGWYGDVAISKHSEFSLIHCKLFLKNTVDL